RHAFEQVQDSAVYGGPIGAIALLIAAMAIFAQFERAFNRIWRLDIDSDKTFLQSVVDVLTHRLRAFALLSSLAVAIIAVFCAGIGFRTFKSIADENIANLPWIWWFLETLLGLMLNAVVFMLIYRLLPKAHVAWGLALRGGIVAAVIWEVGRQLLAAIVIGQRYTSAYGVIGSLLAIMLWVYYCVAVVFVGAEYIQVLREGVSTEHDNEDPLAAGPTSRRILDWMFALCILYVGSFFVLREVNTYILPHYEKDDPRHKVVIFSRHGETHQVTRNFFAPLIELVPGDNYFPNANEVEHINQWLPGTDKIPTNPFQANRSEESRHRELWR
ncbi:MAG: YihY/virulence factor BrkB family protein, partial [Planctomycetota bacterium]